MKKQFSLGKGLMSLIPPPQPPETVSSSKNHPAVLPDRESVYYVEVNKIRPNPDQPRRDFDEESLRQLAQSIKRYGILQPLLVTKIEKESTRGIRVAYQLIAGERRLRAAKLIGLPHVPVIVKDVAQAASSRQSLEMALIENLQRENLNPIESAKAYLRLRKEFGFSTEEIASKIGKSEPVVENMIRLLNLPDEIQQAIAQNKIGWAHGRALLSFADTGERDRLFRRIIAGEKITKNDLERMAAYRAMKVREKISGRRELYFNRSANARYGEFAASLSRRLNTRVSVLGGASSATGRIVVHFQDEKQLDKVITEILK